jgi:putative copper resistance protein D
MDTAGLLADLARLLQYGGAVIVFGTALFCLKSLPPSGDASASRLRWPKPLLAGAAFVLVWGSLMSWFAQSATMGGVSLSHMDYGTALTILTDMSWGHAVLVRFALGLIACLATLVAKPGRPVFMTNMALGAVILGTFAFTGHGAATDGPLGWLHLGSDILHSLAAGLWLGALVAFLMLVRSSGATTEPQRSALAGALKGFSGTGTLLVAVLLATGIVNSLFLVSLSNISAILTSGWARLLAIKLLVFAAMLGLAALNRFRLTPTLEAAETPDETAHALMSLRRSLVWETLAGAAVLALVAVLGMMEPPSAQ